MVIPNYLLSFLRWNPYLFHARMSFLKKVLQDPLWRNEDTLHPELSPAYRQTSATVRCGTVSASGFVTHVNIYVLIISSY